MKKQYIQPSFQSYHISPQQIVCGSGDGEATIKTDSSGAPVVDQSGDIILQSQGYRNTLWDKD